MAAARSKGKASLALSEQADDSPALIRSLKSLGLLELSLGKPEEAAGYLEHGLALEAEAGYDPGVLRLVPDAVEALLAAGRPQAARPLVEALEANGRRLGRPWALATAARARGLLEAASGDLARAQTALEGALRDHKGLPQPFELARTLLAMGIVRRRGKRKREARQSLGQALAIFQELGAALWAGRTRAELGRIGGRAPSPAGLTPTEERVAELVAEGHTNREVAGGLIFGNLLVLTLLARNFTNKVTQGLHDLVGDGLEGRGDGGDGGERADGERPAQNPAAAQHARRRQRELGHGRTTPTVTRARRDRPAGRTRRRRR